MWAHYRQCELEAGRATADLSEARYLCAALDNQFPKVYLYLQAYPMKNRRDRRSPGVLLLCVAAIVAWQASAPSPA
jgi:hypothetical protein